MNDIFPEATVFKKWHFFLPEFGTLMPLQVGDAPVLFVLIKTVHLVGVINGAP